MTSSGSSPFSKIKHRRSGCFSACAATRRPRIAASWLGSTLLTSPQRSRGQRHPVVDQEAPDDVAGLPTYRHVSLAELTLELVDLRHHDPTAFQLDPWPLRRL